MADAADADHAAARFLLDAIAPLADAPPAGALDLLRLGLALGRLGRFELVVSSADHALAVDAACVPAYIVRGDALLELARADHALASFDGALRTDPNALVAHGRRSVALMALGRHDDALVACETGLDALRGRRLERSDEGARLHRQRGLVLRAAGELEQAVAAHERALEIWPDYADAWCSRGTVLLVLRRAEEALSSYGRAAAIAPELVAAHAGRGLALMELGRRDESLADYDEALRLLAAQSAGRGEEAAVVHGNRGAALLGLGRFDEALVDIELALAIRPGAVECWINRGQVLMNLGRVDEALSSHDQAVLVGPGHVQAHRQRAATLVALGRLDDALTACDRAIVIAQVPDETAPLLVSRGVVLHGLGRFEDALASAERALSIRPALADAHACKGDALQSLERPQEAIHAYGLALAIDPRHAGAHLGQGIAWRQLKRPEQALACIDRSLDARPDFPEAHCNRGLVLMELLRLDEAVACFERAIDLRRSAGAGLGGDYPLAELNRAFAWLLTGALVPGFAAFEWRWQALSETPRAHPSPCWDGRADLRGKTVLLYHDAGLGDSLQFCRYAALVKARGARVLLQVPKTLVALLRPLAGVDDVVADGEVPPAHDLHVPLMSLAHRFGTTLETVPQREAYLFADETRRAVWAERLGERRAMRVGLAWSGNPTHKNDFNRSVVLSELLRGLPPEVEYVSLQKELRTEDDRAVVDAGRVRHVGDQIEDFADTAALCSLMDVVVSVDTSVAHLAGALGRPTWILLPYLPDWRWLLGRTDSPWYASATLYRQGEQRQWAEVIERVAHDLAGVAARA